MKAINLSKTYLIISTCYFRNDTPCQNPGITVPLRFLKGAKKNFPYFFNTKVSIEIKENNSGGSKFLCLCISVLTVNSRPNPPIDV